MSFSHVLLNVILWTSLAAWFVKFLHHHSHRRTQRRQRHLGSPSISCERSPDWRYSALGMFRRDGD